MMPKNTNIRIGFVGAGGIARSRHLPNLQKLPGVEFTAVANRSPITAERAAKDYGFKKVYADWHDVITDEEVDAVFICTPPYMHREMTVFALKNGKHVFCQARMAMDLQDAVKMWEADRQTGLTTMLCPPPMYMAAAPYVRRYMEEGRLGEIRHIVVTHPSDSYLDPHQPLHWRQRKDLQGINALDIGMVAEVINSWFGPVARLSAMAKTWLPERKADADGKTAVQLPDSVTVHGEFRRGALLTAMFTGAVAGGRSQMTIYGSQGSLTCFASEAYVIIQDRAGERTIEIPAEQRGEWEVEAQFVRAIREGAKGTPSFLDGVNYMGFTQAVTDSITLGRSIEVKSQH
jgi:predicted dehydrogenase